MMDIIPSLQATHERLAPALEAAAKPPRKRKPRAKAKPKNVQHSAAAHDWGSARLQIDIGRAVLGHLTVDPFSSPKWNTVIGAERIITEAEDGYVTPWIVGAPAPGVDEGDNDAAIARRLRPNDNTAWVNAPGDPSGRNIKRAWAALELYHRRGWLGGGAFWVGFSLNSLQTLQDLARDDGYRSPFWCEFSRCIPESRIAYMIAPNVESEQPSQPSWMLLMPSLEKKIAERQRFAFNALAGRLGEVW